MITRTADHSKIFMVDIAVRKDFAKDLEGIDIQQGQAEEGVNMKINKHDTGKTVKARIWIKPTRVRQKRRKIVKLTNV